MGQEVQVIARMDKSMKRELHQAKRETGMTVKAILRKAVRDWLDKHKGRPAAE